MFVAIAGMLIASCETDPIDNLETDVTVNLELMSPSPSLDNSSDGMYAGVIVADNNNFHGKLWVNLNNNSNYSAMIETTNKEVYHLELKEKNNGVFTYSGSIGSFDFTPLRDGESEITNVTIKENIGVARVLKETSQARMMAILGTYDNAFGGNETGTWSFMAPDQQGAAFNLVTETIITTSTNHMITESEFEAGNTGCYNFGGPIPPVFANYPNEADIPDDPATPDVDESATRDFALIMTNQTLPIPNVADKTVLYDISFSQDVADNNDLDYNRFLGEPQITGPFLFTTPPTGCSSVPDRQGFYIIVDDAGTATGGGNIFIDVSGLIPPPPTRVASSSTLNTPVLKPQF